MFSTSLTALLAERVSDRKEAVTLIYGLNSILIVISATCLALRLYTRAFVIRALGADDAMAVVAFVSSSCAPDHRLLGKKRLLTKF